MFEGEAATTDLKVRLIEVTPSSGGILTIGAGGTAGFYFGLDGYNRAMQSFTSIGNTVLSVKAYISTSNFPSDSVVVKLYTANASHYPDTLIATSSSVPGSSMPANSSDFLEATFTFTGVSVSPDVEYCLVLERTGSITYASYYIIRTNSSAPAYYTGGILASFNGSTWSVPGSITNNDLNCIIDQSAGTVRSSEVQIAEWTHTAIAETFATAEQTLTAPQVASIADFANLFAELDDNQGNVYRFEIGDPSVAIEAPVKVRYRYKKMVVVVAPPEAEEEGDMLLYPTNYEPPSANYATLDTRNNHPVLDFDATTAEAAIWTFVLPVAYAGGGITVAVAYSMETATSGTCGFTVAIERIGDGAQDVDADGFASAQAITAVTVPATSGLVDVMSLNISAGANMGSLAAGEMGRLRLTRDVAVDTAAGDAEVHWVRITET
jgi:hypothetical protein